MQFVEMLEMFGRAAVMYYDNNPHLVEVPLPQKIELTLDIVFEPFGLVRKPVKLSDVEEDSQSDNEY
jgi:hypothetical protein